MDYAVALVITVLIAVRFALWGKYRNEARGHRIAIGTLQLLLVVFWVILVGFRPQWSLSVSMFALFGIIALSFVPARKNLDL